MNGLRNYIQERDGQHVSGPQRQKILQILTRPIPPHHKIPANQIPRRRDQPQPRRQRRPKCQIMSHMECGSPAAAFAIYPSPLKAVSFPKSAIPKERHSERARNPLFLFFSATSVFLCLGLFSPHPECRNKITSPSCTMYSFPSNRTCAFSRAAAILPAAKRSLHFTTSARMNPRSISL